ncbi:MAG: serine O-acetyltransferase [Phycisphaerae bacterium]
MDGLNDRIDRQLSDLIDSLLESYGTDPRTQRIGETFLPSRSAIVEIIEMSRQLLFPGHFGHKKLTDSNIRYHVGSLLSRLGDVLAEQIEHCVCTECMRHNGVNCSVEQCRTRSAEMAGQFLKRLVKIRDALALDAQAAYDGDPAAKSIDEIIYCYPGFLAVTIYRLAHELVELGVPLMPRIMSEHAHSITGCDIHPGATIGASFFIDHATGVVIGETTEIGRNVKIYQGVTLGALSFPKDERGRAIKGLKRHPTIEDRVTIYANATILGGDTVIGEGVTVAGNTFVMESVTAGSLVTQEPPKLTVRTKKK